MHCMIRFARGFSAGVLTAGVLLCVSPPLLADDAPDPTLRLREALAAHPDRPGFDTALIFTNLGRVAAKVSMKAYDANGHPAGGMDLEVPGNGVAYVLASDFDNTPEPTADTERRFVGKVEALGRGNLTGTAVLIGGPVTDLPVIVKPRAVPVAPAPTANTTIPPVPEYVTQITFPIVAAY